MMNDHNDNIIEDDQERSNSSDSTGHGVDEVGHEQFLLHDDDTSSNVTSYHHNATLENNGDNSSSKSIDKVTKTSDDSNIIAKQKQKSLMTKGGINSEIRKDYDGPNPNENPSSHILADNVKPLKCTEWVIEHGKECLTQCEKIMGKYGNDTLVGNYRMRITKATTETEVIKVLCDFACAINTSVTNEEIRCLAVQCLQEYVNMISMLSNEEDMEEPLTVVHRENSIKGSQDNHCSRTSPKIVNVDDKFIKVSKPSSNSDEELIGTVSHLKQNPSISVTEDIVVMPAIGSVDSTSQGRFDGLMLSFMLNICRSHGSSNYTT